MGFKAASARAYHQYRKAKVQWCPWFKAMHRVGNNHWRGGMLSMEMGLQHLWCCISAHRGSMLTAGLQQQVHISAVLEEAMVGHNAVMAEAGVDVHLAVQPVARAAAGERGLADDLHSPSGCAGGPCDAVLLRHRGTHVGTLQDHD